MNTQLKDLMHRATENLEPVTPDLLERSVAQGVRHRRRRTTLLAATGTGAVLATAGLIAGGIQLIGSPADSAAAGLPAAKPSVNASAKPSIKPSTGPSGKSSGKPSTKPTSGGSAGSLAAQKQTLSTLRTLLKAPGRQLSAPQTWGDSDNFAGAGIVVDDGKGGGYVSVALSSGDVHNPCSGGHLGCTTLPDGSVIRTLKNQPEYSDSRQAKEGVLSNSVELYHPNGRTISIISFNGPAEKGERHTLAKPVLTVAQLTTLAKSTTWKFPVAKISK
ncbi:hypothetical protein [Kribbella sp. NPDC048928]|uniref:hypothetical protein n=1 Tax=Kribbella sp. NPDC048928 TaxID=3364111 RepID=UPI0037207182